MKQNKRRYMVNIEQYGREYKTALFQKVKHVGISNAIFSRDVFKTLSNIYDGAFLQ